MRDRGLARTVRGAAGVLVALALGAGCGTRVQLLYEQGGATREYSLVTESFTRKMEVHDGLDLRFALAATWLSPEWLRAFSREYAHAYYLAAARTEEEVSAWKAESEQYTRFVVALVTPDDREIDLEKRGTLWSVHLVRSDETSYDPVYVRKSGMKPPEVEYFFPHLSRWYKVYLVAFPKEAGEEVPGREGAPRLKLVLSGVRGRAVLSWGQ